jgi:phenylalanyl-tRNA synthetase beta chain
VKVPWKWLNKYVELPWEPEEAARRFTLAGLKVETLGHSSADAQLSHEKAELSSVVTGKVRSIVPHPRRPDLNVGLVDVGRERLSIVSGAPGFAAGNTVLVAVPGATLPGGTRVGARDFGGVQSQGMVVCSNEILCGAEHRPGEDIIVLPEGTALGVRAQDVLDLDDWVFEFDLTVNYSHCLSILGLAIEAAAMAQRPLRLPRALEAWDWAGATGSRPPEGEEPYCGDIRVRLPDKDLCPRYVGKIVRDVRFAYSPVKVERLLMLAGMRPVSAIVDATNYVMLETGQPLHAFDLDKLVGDMISARRSRRGETIVTLDGASHELQEGTLVIADAEGPVAVAGVMGGGRTEVSESTKDLLLESAYFAPLPVRLTSQRLKLRTEAALRFEKGIDPTAQAAVAERAACFIADVAGGRVVPGRADEDLLAARPKEITISARDVRRTLGVPIPMDECERILRALRFQAARASSVTFAAASGGGRGAAEETLTVIVPPRRVDVDARVDLVEEIARHYGYDRFIGESLSPAVPGGPPDRDFVRFDRMRDFLVSVGGTEVVSTSFLSTADLRALGWGEDDPRGDPVAVMNPLLAEESCLRTSLLPGILKDLKANQNVRAPGGFFWETGRVFFRSNEELPLEAVQLALASYGTLIPGTWAQAEKAASFYQLKGAVETLLALLGTSQAVFLPKAGMPFHPGKSGRIVVDGSAAGEIGEIHPACLRNLDMGPACVAAWLSVDALLAAAKESSYVPVPRFMPVERDLAVIVGEEVPAGEVIAAVKETAKDLTTVTLFDVYRKPPVPEGKKSMALRLVYQPADRTLTEDDLSADRQRVLQRLERDFGAKQRL